jgi:hypothetical protein
MAIKPGVTLTGVKETVRELDLFVPGAINSMRKELRTIAQPAINTINSRVPVMAPLRGMMHSGRTQYGGAKATFALPLTKLQQDRDVHPLVQIQVKSPKGAAGFNIADMAGRGSGKGRRASSQSALITTRSGAQYRYTKRGQGQALIRALRSKASRFVYPGVERALPSMTKKTLAVLDRYAAMVNRKLERI